MGLSYVQNTIYLYYLIFTFVLLNAKLAQIHMSLRSDPNRCAAWAVEPLLPLSLTRKRRIGNVPATPPPRPAKRVREQAPPASPRLPSPRLKRLREDDEKVDMLRRYSQWVADGKRRGESPATALNEEYGCNISYPKRLYDKQTGVTRPMFEPADNYALWPIFRKASCH